MSTYTRHNQKYYQEHKEECDARTAKWKLEHPAEVKEINRRSYYKTNHGTDAPPVGWSWFRNVVCESLHDPIFCASLRALPLTEKQRQMVELTIAGRTQKEIAAIMGCNQPCITKAWNGNAVYENGVVVRVDGGIYKKWKRHYGE